MPATSTKAVQPQSVIMLHHCSIQCIIDPPTAYLTSRKVFHYVAYPDYGTVL
jgi:hypothetical protein